MTYQELYKALTSEAVWSKEQFAENLVKITNREKDLKKVINTLNFNCEE